MSENVILQSNLTNHKIFKQGKVRDIYDLGENYLIVSTDRISAFDVIMNQGIPFKGAVLNQISKFWFDYTKDIIDNHIITTDVEEFPESLKPDSDMLKNRSMIVKKAEPVMLECIVRAYITGSGWKEYQKQGTVCSIKLPEGLRESDKLSEPIFTPSTKAEIGEHDENISVEKAAEIVGKETLEEITDISLRVFKKISDFAYQKGIIIADTKMEFGIYKGKIILIDELLTPDSSRFWPLDDYQPGRSQSSYDKQYVRDYLSSIKFTKQPPAPDLPPEVIKNTSEKYLEALNKLTNIRLD